MKTRLTKCGMWTQRKQGNRTMNNTKSKNIKKTRKHINIGSPTQDHDRYSVWQWIKIWLVCSQENFQLDLQGHFQLNIQSCTNKIKGFCYGSKLSLFKSITSLCSRRGKMFTPHKAESSIAFKNFKHSIMLCCIITFLQW